MMSTPEIQVVLQNCLRLLMISLVELQEAFLRTEIGDERIRGLKSFLLRGMSFAGIYYP